ncbi:MAG TPA: iron-sulfur cluster assembly accessory protein [Anaerolineales bacterium]|nr:iron-sulfur cluster assembly accessory protein [Anaerolineales bacterium]
MLKEIDIQTISLTPAASKAVSDILTERKLEDYALRVYLAGSSCCSGVSFGMALDNNIRDVDRIFESEGVKIVVDEVSMDYLQGARIDFVNDPERGAGFLVDSPLADAHAHEHEEGGCACGGSCSCNS